MPTDTVAVNLSGVLNNSVVSANGEGLAYIQSPRYIHVDNLVFEELLKKVEQLESKIKLMSELYEIMIDKELER